MHDTTRLEALRALAVAANLAVCAGYVGLGLFLAPKFDAGGPSWALRVFKWAGVLFFAMCAVTHAHEAYHVWDGTLPPAYWLTWHYLGHMLVQGGASGTALVFAFGFINVRVFDRRHTRAMIDRMVDEAADAAAEEGRRRSVSEATADAYRARETAELILAALGKEPTRDAV